MNLSTPVARAAVTLGACAILALAFFTGEALAGPADAFVNIKDFDFQPMAVSVPVGATVTWKNLDEEPHTVTSTSGAFRSAALDEGETFRFRFTRPGVYKYLCTVHPKMTATVTVK
jgi:plastocyanin